MRLGGKEASYKVAEVNLETRTTFLSKLHKYSTQPAAHSQDTKTGGSKGGRW